MTFPTWKVLPLAQQVATYFKLAADHYNDLETAQGSDAVRVEDVASFLEAKMVDWDPKVGGKQVLDPDTKAAAARFFAGVAVNYTKD